MPKRAPLDLNVFADQTPATEPTLQVVPAAPTPAPRKDASTTNDKKGSYYMPWPAFEQLEELVSVLNKGRRRDDPKIKFNDLLLRGVDLVFKQHGLPPIADLTKKE